MSAGQSTLGIQNGGRDVTAKRRQQSNKVRCVREGGRPCQHVGWTPEAPQVFSQGSLASPMAHVHLRSRTRLFLYPKPVLRPCHLRVMATRKDILGSFVGVNRVNPGLVSVDTGPDRQTRVLVRPLPPTPCSVSGRLLYLFLNLDFLICKMSRDEEWCGPPGVSARAVHTRPGTA